QLVRGEPEEAQVDAGEARQPPVLARVRDELVDPLTIPAHAVDELAREGDRLWVAAEVRADPDVLLARHVELVERLECQLAGLAPRSHGLRTVSRRGGPAPSRGP